MFSSRAGSFLNPKFTGLALFVAPEFADKVEVLALHRHSFGASEGSKGGVGLAIRVHDSTIAFVNCHLASKKMKMRFDQYMDLCKSLGKLGDPNFQLNEQFHHVVWMGDLNYRCSGISGETAKEIITSGNMDQLLQHDDLLKAKVRTYSRTYNIYR